MWWEQRSEEMRSPVRGRSGRGYVPSLSFSRPVTSSAWSGTKEPWCTFAPQYSDFSPRVSPEGFFVENENPLVRVGWGRVNPKRSWLGSFWWFESLERNSKNSRLVLRPPPPLFLGKFKGKGVSLGQRANASTWFSLRFHRGPGSNPGFKPLWKAGASALRTTANRF